MSINITVNKVELLSKLRDNRDLHGESFRAAMEGYKELVTKELERKIRHVSEGKVIDSYVNNQPPEDHTKDYDEIIEMLEMSIGTEVPLTHAQFKQYVRDDWSWKPGWSASNSEYITASSMK